MHNQNNGSRCLDTLNQASVTCQDEALLLNASVGSQMAANTANVTSRGTRG